MSRSRLLALAAPLLLLGCPQPDPGDDDDETDDDDTADLPVIPDPGTAENDWGLDLWDDPCCGVPEEAHPVGLVDRDAGYIQGVIDSGLAFFYVFRTNGITEFGFPRSFEEVHLHDGDGLRFGEAIEPTSDPGDFMVTWDVQDDHIYVVEIASSFEGFF